MRRVVGWLVAAAALLTGQVAEAATCTLGVGASSIAGTSPPTVTGVGGTNCSPMAATDSVQVPAGAILTQTGNTTVLWIDVDAGGIFEAPLSPSATAPLVLNITGSGSTGLVCDPPAPPLLGAVCNLGGMYLSFARSPAVLLPDPDRVAYFAVGEQSACDDGAGTDCAVSPNRHRWTYTTAVYNAADGTSIETFPDTSNDAIVTGDIVGTWNPSGLPLGVPCMGLLASVRPGLTECYLSDASENAA